MRMRYDEDGIAYVPGLGGGIAADWVWAAAPARGIHTHYEAARLAHRLTRREIAPGTITALRTKGGGLEMAYHDGKMSSR